MYQTARRKASEYVQLDELDAKSVPRATCTNELRELDALRVRVECFADLEVEWGWDRSCCVLANHKVDRGVSEFFFSTR